jgi:glycosyltransferase involved in cell wall biosynthesis
MHAINTINSLSHSAGGTTQSVAALGKHVAAMGSCRVTLTAFEDDDTVHLDISSPSLSLELVRRQPGVWRLPQNLAALEETLRDLVAREDECLLHDHGLWLPLNHRVATVAQSLGVPRIVSTHGMLEPWSVKHQRWKKRLAWYLYQRRDLRSADVLQATSQQETRHLRGQGLQQPIAVIPNGVPLPDARKTEPPEGEERTALSLSRIHPQKGLPMLLKAWTDVRPDGWRLVIAGPGEDGHRAELERQTRRLGLEETVSFPGAIPDDEKWRHYRTADLFVLPTHSENFGIVVAEALASGVPAITTTGAPWQELETERCGWWTAIGTEALAQALREAVALSDEERLAMGRRGRALVAERYSWEHVAEQMRAVYAWLLGEGGRPECVRRG